MTESENNFQNVENQEVQAVKSDSETKKEVFMKYLLIFIATVTGAFLAFYFVIDMTIKNMLNPEYQMRRMNREISRIDRNIGKDFDKEFRDFDKNMKHMGKMVPNPVIIEKDNDEYKVIIDLKPFGGNAKNVNVNVTNENMLKIEASNEVKKGEKEKITNMIQTYLLENKVDVNEISKEEKGGKYIIELPYLR